MINSRPDSLVWRRGQQVGELLFAVLGAGFAAWAQRTAMKRGYFYGKAIILFPGFLVHGAALVLFLGHKGERIPRSCRGFNNCYLEFCDH